MSHVTNVTCSKILDFNWTSESFLDDLFMELQTPEEYNSQNDRVLIQYLLKNLKRKRKKRGRPPTSLGISSAKHLPLSPKGSSRAFSPLPVSLPSPPKPLTYSLSFSSRPRTQRHLLPQFPANPSSKSPSGNRSVGPRISNPRC